jgi:hypothetical protein
MQNNTTPIARRGRSRRFLTSIGALIGMLIVPLVACQDLLEVDDPDIVTPENLESDLGLETLRNGALSQFTLAWTGGGAIADNFVLHSGLMADEWIASGTYPTRQEVDQRSIQLDNGTLEGMFLVLHQARADLERAAVAISDNAADPSADERIPEMQVFAGYMYIGFAENYCSGVPFSETVDSIFYGDPMTTTAMLEQAVEYFDAVISHPAALPDHVSLARIGKGRALLNLDRPDDAAQAVADVPDDFVIHLWHSNAAGRTRNGIWEMNVSAGRWSAADTEGGNGLPFRTASDPRVPWDLVGMGFDGVTDLYDPGFYLGRLDRFPIASGVEARLIEAEAHLRNDQPAEWLGTLNALREDFPTYGALLYPDNPLAGTLAPLDDPGTDAAREDLHFAERGFWLHSTGHRLGDLRRLVRQYDRSIESVFPSGAYFKGGAYGVDVNFPVPQQELNNPKFTQCLDRNP